MQDLQSKCHGRLISTLIAVFMVTMTCANGQVQVRQEPQVSLSGQVDLLRLVDLAALRQGLTVEYDASVVKGSVTLRGTEQLTDQQLWDLTNRVLSERGFASVRLPGTNTLSIVKLTDAPGMVQPRLDGQIDPQAGYTSLVVQIRNATPKSIVDSVKNILSKPGGSVTDLGGGLILISDLTSRIGDAQQLIERLDVPGPQPTIERIYPRFINATQLVAQVTATTVVRDSISGQPLKGKVIAAADGDSLLLICPPDEAGQWRNLVDQIDQRPQVVTQTYSPRHFASADVAALLEQTARDRGPRGSGDQWRVVVDDLTASLIITAAPSEHERIVELIRRLDSVPSEARRPVRVYQLRNRSVKEILDIVTKLVESGALQVGVDEGPDNETSQPKPSVGDQTSINTQPPLSLIPGAASASGTTNQASGTNGDRLRSERTGSTRWQNISGAGMEMGAKGALDGQQVPLKLTADEGTNSLIAVGEARLLGQLDDLIRRLDVRQPQVMIEVMVVSLTDSDSLNLGVELQRLEINGSTIIALSSLFGLGSPALTGASAALPRGRGFTGVVLDPGDFSVVVQALQSLNKGRSLSMPKVLVNNNQQAVLNSVLQQPFSSTNASTTVATTSFGGTQDAGTTVTVKPQIAEGDHLVLDYSVTLSAFVGTASDPSLPPPRQSNNLTSAVTIPDGYTIVVGGLELTTLGDAVSQVPLLGSIPLLGEAFKNRNKSQSRSRFFVFIRSEVLRNSNFEDLKYLSDQAAVATDIDDGWPEVEPRIIR